jgi:hypothetical protein
LLGIADRNGGRAAMRELIAVTPLQQSELKDLVRAASYLKTTSHERLRSVAMFSLRLTDW